MFSSYQGARRAAQRLDASISRAWSTGRWCRYLGGVSAATAMVFSMQAAAQDAAPRTTVVAIQQSNAQVFQATVRFPAPSFEAIRAGGQRWTRLSVPGTVPSGAAGGPEIPVVRHLLAIPTGAEPVVRAVARVRQSSAVDLYPHQPLDTESSTRLDQYQDRLPPRELFDGAPFSVDAGAYTSQVASPAMPCQPLRILGRSRDLTVAELECAAAQYYPAQRKLVSFESIEVEIAFRGSRGSFLSEDSLSPFEAKPTTAVLNHAAVYAQATPSVRTYTCFGEEFLILTHPKYSIAAHALAAWKSQRGMMTSVFEVNDGVGPGPDTKEAIDEFIDRRYEKCRVRVSYILLLGDSNDIPTFVQQRLIKDPGETVATDFPYSTYHQSATAQLFFADFALGRIPVATQEQAQAVVDKIIHYESRPAFDPGYYRAATIASYFQCCRTDVPLAGVEDGRRFILNAEHLREQLLDRNFSVQRIYTTSNHSEYTGDETPRYFGDQTALPSDLGPASGFPWNGATNDVIDAFNAGRQFMFHIDHGYTQGWGDPSFSTSNIPSLTNTGNESIVFNFDCSSGNFESSSFAEGLLKHPNGGAVAAFGWTRMSNTGYYRSLIDGSLDAIWPDTISDYGDASSQLRLGDLFNHSRNYMATVKAGSDPSSTAYQNTINHVRLYHLFGDPTMTVRTGVTLKLPTYVAYDRFPDHINVRYPIDGVVITAMQKTAQGLVVLGRAQVRGGAARMTLLSELAASASIVFTGLDASGEVVELTAR